jgi:hypothetical protein
MAVITVIDERSFPLKMELLMGRYHSYLSYRARRELNSLMALSIHCQLLPSELGGLS